MNPELIISNETIFEAIKTLEMIVLILGGGISFLIALCYILRKQGKGKIMRPIKFRRQINE